GGGAGAGESLSPRRGDLDAADAATRHAAAGTGHAAAGCAVVDRGAPGRRVRAALSPGMVRATGPAGPRPAAAGAVAHPPVGADGGPTAGTDRGPAPGTDRADAPTATAETLGLRIRSRQQAKQGRQSQ